MKHRHNIKIDLRALAISAEGPLAVIVAGLVAAALILS